LAIASSRLRWWFVALLAVAVGAVVFATQPRPASHDASIWVIIGRGWISGQAPYLGLWDYKPPGVYLVGALAWLFDPNDTTVSMQALSVAAGALAATACGWIVATAYSRFWAGVVTAVAVAGGFVLPNLSYGGGMSELFGVVWIAASVAAIAGMTLNRQGLIWPAAAGAAFACALGQSWLVLGAVPALAAVWLSIPIDGAAYPIRRSSWRTWIRRRVFDQRLGVAIAAAAVVSLAFWLPVVAMGGFPAGFDAVTRYQNLYRAAGSFQLRAWVEGIAYIWPLWLPTLLVCLTPTARGHLLGFSVARSRLAQLAVLWVVAQIALLLVGHRFYGRYLLMIVPPLGLLFGVALCALWVERPRISRRVVGAVTSAAVVLGLGWQSLPAVPTDTQLAANADLASVVRANSAPGDTIYVWGTDPDLYLRSDRMPAGPYLQIHPLVMPGFDDQAVATMLDLWQAHPPRLIVVSKETTPDLVGLYPLLKTADLGNPLRTNYAALEPLQAFIQAHYELVATLEVGEVWRYRG
jgi:hypothetical protein